MELYLVTRTGARTGAVLPAQGEESGEAGAGCKKYDIFPGYFTTYSLSYRSSSHLHHQNCQFTFNF